MLGIHLGCVLWFSFQIRLSDPLLPFLWHTEGIVNAIKRGIQARLCGFRPARIDYAIRLINMMELIPVWLAWSTHIYANICFLPSAVYSNRKQSDN